MAAGLREMVPGTKLSASYCSMKGCASSKPCRKMENRRDSVACAVRLLCLNTRDDDSGVQVPIAG
jgi:hypothetical protein